GNGERGGELGDAFEGAARTRAGDEGALDAGAGRVSRPLRQFRSGLALSQAETEAASAHLPRRGERPHRAAGGRILRRLVPPSARRLGAPDRGGAAAPNPPRRPARAPRALHHRVLPARPSGAPPPPTPAQKRS